MSKSMIGLLISKKKIVFLLWNKKPCYKFEHEISCNYRNIPLRLKENFYKTTIKPTLLYGEKCQTIKKYHLLKISMRRCTCLFDVRQH